MVPPRLRRENCLVGDLLSKRLGLFAEYSASAGCTAASTSSGVSGDSGSMSTASIDSSDAFWARDLVLRGKQHGVTEGSTQEQELRKKENGGMSRFERIVTSHPTIMESLFAQLPTASLIDLYHTSRHLRGFLQEYPLAWKSLSFRLPVPTQGIDTPDPRDRLNKQYALDGMLFDIIAPLARTLRNLDLCNTAISGTELVAEILTPQCETLQHLSVRGCKNVSIKYHIVPWLHMQLPRSIRPQQKKLALKSLYVYRCRHHRRRPYLPSSLIRRDSDSEPTHDLIELCHSLGIWTDTAWCPTPGGRCFRRKDYHNNRAAPGTFEVWVPFDRLWRSGNRLGRSDEVTSKRRSDGRLWEDAETGYDGEALGPSNSVACLGEGKDVPAHLRHSHRTFIDDVKCGDCGDPIQERCETCSIKMHCMGCRKTLCASCAFDKPIPRKRRRIRNFGHMLGNANGPGANSDSSYPATPVGNRTALGYRGPKFWWAPGASRSPNLLTEDPNNNSDTESDDDSPPVPLHNLNSNNASSTPPKLDMFWCCLEPIFSGGGGVAFLGPHLTGSGQDRIRAVPLPKQTRYEDPEFTSLTAAASAANQNAKNLQLYESIMGDAVNIYPYLAQPSIDAQANTCPRSICKDCYQSFRWKVPCRSCKKPLCKEHDFRALKVRKCGYRVLENERDHVLRPPVEPVNDLVEALRIPAFGEKARSSSSRSSSSASRRNIGDGNLAIPEFGFTPLSQHPSNPPDRSTTPAPELFAQATSSQNAFRLPSARGSYLRRSMHRSRSMTGLRGLAASSSSSSSQSQQTTSSIFASPHIESRLPLPGSNNHPVQWRGCGAYFCPPNRPPGDPRPRCSSSNALRSCAECSVLVCEFCVPPETETCSCTACRQTFYCPYCASTSHVQQRCQRKAEAAHAAHQARLQQQREAEEQHRSSLIRSNLTYQQQQQANAAASRAIASAVEIGAQWLAQRLGEDVDVDAEGMDAGILVGPSGSSGAHLDVDVNDGDTEPMEDGEYAEMDLAGNQSGVDGTNSRHGDGDEDTDADDLLIEGVDPAVVYSHLQPSSSDHALPAPMPSSTITSTLLGVGVASTSASAASSLQNSRASSSQLPTAAESSATKAALDTGEGEHEPALTTPVLPYRAEETEPDATAGASRD